MADTTPAFAPDVKAAMDLHEAGKLSEAAALYRNILTRDPKNFLVLHLLANIAMHCDNAPLVLALADEGLRNAPDVALLHQDRATALRRLGRKEDALTAIEKAIALGPGTADFYDTLAAILRDMRFYERAIEALHIAVRMEPDNPKFHNNLSICLGRIGRNDEALAALNTYIKLKPETAEGYNNRANIFKSMGRYDAAIADYEKALAINPHIFMGRTNKGMSHLVLGDFERGWALFEDRKPGHKLPEAGRFDPQKRWRGAPTDGTLILYNEQGLGDTIQFCRYVPMVRGRAKRVMLQVQKPLAAWLQHNWPDLPIITDTDPLPDYAAQCPLMSLPFVFGTTVNSIPSPGPYLDAHQEKMSFWKHQLPQDGRKKIGLVWAGNPDHMNDHVRSIRLVQCASILAMPDMHFFSLQKGDAALAQIADLPSTINITPLGDRLHDFSDTAALLKNLDLLISVDTAVLHAAGSIGTPALALLQFDPDWRWMVGRPDTPWYQHTRLLRQKSFGDWDGVLGELSAILSKTL